MAPGAAMPCHSTSGAARTGPHTSTCAVPKLVSTSRASCAHGSAASARS